MRTLTPQDEPIYLPYRESGGTIDEIKDETVFVRGLEYAIAPAQPYTTEKEDAFS